MVELKFKVKKQNIQVFKDILSKEDAESLAIKNKEKAFSMISTVTQLFKKNSAVSISHWEKRFEPFWYIRAEGYVEYKKENTYRLEVAPQVRDITINGKKLQVAEDNPVCAIPATDHCVEQNVQRVLVSAVDAKTHSEKFLKQYLKFDSKVIKETEALMGKDKVVVPAQVRASYLVRDLFKNLINPVHADKIIDESVSITDMILFFRPIFAFELQNTSGNTGVLEVDALTSEVKKGKVYKRALAELVNEDTLFEIGAEIASELIPGAGIGAMIGKKVHEHHKKKKNIKLMQKSKSAMAKRKKK